MMNKSQLILHTTDATRIAKRLANHWQHKFAVEFLDNQTIIPFSADDTLVLLTSDETLTAILTTQSSTDDNHLKLQQVALEHINRMAKTEFTELWQKVE
ncbi:DUF2218 domain-containing protein [Wielerella bovis]|uniref:DUF2218 domain-containing protein n=1 Tax=Wielerella bovis TaxID=2917790 RepID=UPI0020188007|nr:DUF2218 domain-containing protein [Wielerella bovis]MCG7657352.1 DUF2218 domain-containing protein [Wielerella bovis]MCG7659573.1 DUF2218 domain-containing protein [Wielerella bovis]